MQIFFNWKELLRSIYCKFEVTIISNIKTSQSFEFG